MNLPKVKPLSNKYSDTAVTDVLDIVAVALIGVALLSGAAYGFIMLVVFWSWACALGIGIALLIASLVYALIRFLIAHDY